MGEGGLAREGGWPKERVREKEIKGMECGFRDGR